MLACQKHGAVRVHFVTAVLLKLVSFACFCAKTENMSLCRALRRRAGATVAVIAENAPAGLSGVAGGPASAPGAPWVQPLGRWELLADPSAIEESAASGMVCPWVLGCLVCWMCLLDMPGKLQATSSALRGQRRAQWYALRFWGTTGCACLGVGF